MKIFLELHIILIDEYTHKWKASFKTSGACPGVYYVQILSYYCDQGKSTGEFAEITLLPKEEKPSTPGPTITPTILSEVSDDSSVTITADKSYEPLEQRTQPSDIEVTIEADGDKSYYAGEWIFFSGKNTASETTYLFFTRSSLKSTGEKMSGAPGYVMNDYPDGFEKVKVSNDGTWEYAWNTANVHLDAGTYTIYAANTPKDFDHIYESFFGSESIVIKKPYITAHTSPEKIVKGEAFTISGTAEGDPSNGVQIWIISQNKVLIKKGFVQDDMTYSCELEKHETGGLDVGEAYIVVQHPMYNNEFEVYPDNLIEPSSIYIEYPSKDTLIANMEDTKGIDLAKSLENAIDSKMVDDTYVLLSFEVLPHSYGAIINSNDESDEEISQKNYDVSQPDSKKSPTVELQETLQKFKITVTPTQKSSFPLMALLLSIMCIGLHMKRRL